MLFLLNQLFDVVFSPGLVRFEIIIMLARLVNYQWRFWTCCRVFGLLWHGLESLVEVLEQVCVMLIAGSSSERWKCFLLELPATWSWMCLFLASIYLEKHKTTIKVPKTLGSILYESIRSFPNKQTAKLLAQPPGAPPAPSEVHPPGHSWRHLVDLPGQATGNPGSRRRSPNIATCEINFFEKCAKTILITEKHGLHHSAVVVAVWFVSQYLPVVLIVLVP